MPNNPNDSTSTHKPINSLTNTTADSLILQLERCNQQPQTCHDTTKIQLLRKIGIAYHDLQESIPYYQQALELSISIKNTTQGVVNRRMKKFEADCYNDIGIVQKNLGNYDQAIDNHLKSLSISEELKMAHPNDVGNKKGIANNLNNIGNTYQLQGNYGKALDYCLKSLRIYEELKYKKGSALSLNNIGVIYQYQANYDQALDYYLKSLRIYEELKYKKGIANSLGNIGIIYGLQGNYSQALDYCLKSLRIYEELNDKQGIANSFNNIGGVFYYQNKKDSVLVYFIRSLKIEEEIGDKAGAARSLANIGEIYADLAYVEKTSASRQNNFTKAIAFSDSSMSIAKEIGDKLRMMETGNNLATIYSKLSNYKMAYEYHQLYSTYRDSLFNEEKSKEIGKLEATHEHLMKKADEEEKAKVLKELEEEKKFRENLIEDIIIVITILLLFIVVMRWQKKMSPAVLRFMVFFTTILLFEFLLVLVNPFLLALTGGAPLWLMLVNSAIAAIMFVPQNLIQNKFSPKLQSVPANNNNGNNIIKLLVVVGLVVLNVNSSVNSNASNNPSDTSQLTINNLPLTINSQDSLINHLQLTINNSKDDTTKIKLLIKIGAAYHYSQESLPYYQQALELSISLKSKKFEADCYNDIGLVQDNLGNYDQAIDNYLKSLRIFEELKYKKDIAANFNNIGEIYRLQGNYDHALDYYLKSLRIYEELKMAHPNDIGNKKGIANSLNNIGIIYDLQGNYDQALDYYLKSLRIFEELKDKKGMANSLGNIGVIYRLQGNYNQALNYSLKSLRIFEELKEKKGIANSLNNIGNIYRYQANYDQALDYSLKSLRIFEELKNKQGIAMSLNNIGAVYYYQNKKDSVLVYFIKSLKIAEEIGDKAVVAICLANIGEIYADLASVEKTSASRQNNFTKAIAFSDSSMSIAKEIGDKYMMMTTGNNLATIYSKLNNYKMAYEYHQLYSTYRDSLFNEEKSKEIGKLQTKHDLEMADLKKKQKEEEVRRRESEVRSRRDKLQYSVIVLGVFALIGIALLLSRFTVAAWVIEFLTFVPFLLLFETLLVFTDPYLEQYIGSSPFYTVVANTVFATGLFPLHQFMEKKLKGIFFRKKRRSVEVRNNEMRDELFG